MSGKFVFSAEPDQPEIAPALNFNEGGRALGAFGGIIGQSRVWRQIIKQIEIVAPTDATVLIQGETGTGKELIARELHRRSRRKGKPLVPVNCACIPKELYESEFFGQRENLFSVLQKTGWKIKGADGAAELLGLKPTTLLSRIERMGLVRPL